MKPEDEIRAQGYYDLMQPEQTYAAYVKSRDKPHVYKVIKKYAPDTEEYDLGIRLILAQRLKYPSKSKGDWGRGNQTTADTMSRWLRIEPWEPPQPQPHLQPQPPPPPQFDDAELLLAGKQYIDSRFEQLQKEYARRLGALKAEVKETVDWATTLMEQFRHVIQVHPSDDWKSINQLKDAGVIDGNRFRHQAELETWCASNGVPTRWMVASENSGRVYTFLAVHVRSLKNEMDKQYGISRTTGS